MKTKLLFETLIKIILGLVLLCALLFIPANTINYWNAWLFIGLLFIPMVIVGIVLLYIFCMLLLLHLFLQIIQDT